MKSLKYTLMALASVALFSACNDDDKATGNPIMEIQNEPTAALFGDSLAFSVKASDAEVALSTLKAQLFFNEKMVSETVIRTKVSGETYNGKVFIPFYKNVPNGTATLKFVLQNIHFTISEKAYDLNLSRPDYPSLTLVTEDGAEYTMEKTDLYQYAVKSNFPARLKAHIVAPKMGANGNEITFGWDNNEIVQGSTTDIAFSDYTKGGYTVSFNTKTYEAAPFAKMQLNGKDLIMVNDNKYRQDLDLKQGDVIAVSVPEYESYWIDRDFFEKQADGSLKFLAIDGTYRIIANLQHHYFEVIKMKNGGSEKFENGEGTIYAIGDNVGKPSVSANKVGWTTEKGLAMAQITPKKYQLTLTAGEQVDFDAVNFKFFSEQGWGGEFGPDRLSSTSDIIQVGNKDVNGHDNGNLFMVEGKQLEKGKTYRFVVDMTAGADNAVLSVTKID